ncbi:hypothetical protein KXS07_17565 [Inquilinus limosus]|uniref:hypothetical protein n=1 Tax=Inquilinus limosus TaxID=171674 RepID=UPI003F18F6ED
MAGPVGTDPLNLTGLWHGFFNYPEAYEPGFFEATLVETGEWLSGSTSELSTGEPPVGVTLMAIISGRRRGHHVTFLKSYDGTAGWSHSVSYDGRLSADGLEIEGRWSIWGNWSGTFLMVRAEGGKVAAARRRFAKV